MFGNNALPHENSLEAMQYKKIRYDLECAIELLTACNYRCQYCSGPRARKLVRRGRKASEISKVLDFFNRGDRTWLIGMSGGEPSIHPLFGELIAGLKEKHYFYFFTNLTFDVEAFMDLLPATRVQYLKAALHPEANTDQFLERFETLFGYGYNPILIMVSAPDRFAEIEKVSRFCQDRQYPFTLSVMEGPYSGQNYPEDYSADQVQFIREHTREPGNLIRLNAKVSGGMNTLGLSCPAGQSSFTLDLESGDITTCESVGEVHGNIYQGTFQPQSQPTICPAINGCVGYDRNPRLPNDYLSFFENGWNHWRLAADSTRPVIQAAHDSAPQVESALRHLHGQIQSSRTLFWGAGIYGAKVLSGYRKLFPDCRAVIGFIDSLKDRQGDKILELPVYSPQDPILKEVDCILITSYAFEEDIRKQAGQLGLTADVLALHEQILRPMGIPHACF